MLKSFVIPLILWAFLAETLAQTDQHEVNFQGVNSDTHSKSVNSEKEINLFLLNLLNFKYCEDPDICKNFANSVCHPKEIKGAQTLFECLCDDKPFFKVESTEFLGAHQLRMQTCSGIPLLKRP